ncbi:hypothetical protein [Enorma burkinafasonensis]|uniref:hypothetical protein n=1 Tax=Enorma burkinafasonensis TaxID=2590867 RepID=UPI0026EFD384|nr:hypothetical protein [Enorma burkinafasonensis]MCI7730022.1 hypothetical protein [Enorma burkinafasonensis]
MTDNELLNMIAMTAEEANERDAEYERDEWSKGTFGKPRRGRPSIAEEEVRPYTVRFPVSLMEYVDGKAKKNGLSRSEELRRIVAEDRERESA